jgi:hypothetical protein
MCEGCHDKQPSFGLEADGVNRWCSGCAKQHPGARDVVSKMCEDCHDKQPRYGLEANGVKHRCFGCAKQHPGAKNVATKMCEGCHANQPNFGLEADRVKRWCVGCANQQPNSKTLVNLKTKLQKVDGPTCEDCQSAYDKATRGLRAQNTARWCFRCAAQYAGAVFLRNPTSGTPSDSAITSDSARTAATASDAPSVDRLLVSSTPLLRRQNSAANVAPCVREFPLRAPQAGGAACPACAAAAIGRCGRCIAALKAARLLEAAALKTEAPEAAAPREVWVG